MFIQNIEYLYFFIYIYIYTYTNSKLKFLLSKYKFLIKSIKIIFSFYLLSKKKVEILKRQMLTNFLRTLKNLNILETRALNFIKI
jgi:hypothetical protein